MQDLIRPPFRTDIPEPVLLSPPNEHLTDQGVYIPPEKRPLVTFLEDSDMLQSFQLKIIFDPHRIRRWTLPSWGWIGIRTHYGHSDEEWESFRRRLVDTYYVLDGDEGEKFRIIWIEDREKLDGADDKRTRETFRKWYLDHSDPPNGRDYMIPWIQKVWSGYETNVCLVANKDTIDSVLADTSDTLDESAFIKLLDRNFDEEDMRKWAPKLIGRYTGSFMVSPNYLPSLDGILDEGDMYGQPGSPSTWYMRAARTQDGVFRRKNKMIVDEEFGKDPVNLGQDSDEESEID